MRVAGRPFFRRKPTSTSAGANKSIDAGRGIGVGDSESSDLPAPLREAFRWHPDLGIHALEWRRLLGEAGRFQRRVLVTLHGEDQQRGDRRGGGFR